MDNLNMKKKGQVTIFIILAILIVSAILLYSFWLKPTYLSSSSEKLKIESCVEDVLREAISELALTAGQLEPEFSYQFSGQDIPYLCYSGEYYKQCTVQNPFPEKTFEDNLYVLTEKEIESCYTESVKNLKSKGYSISGEVPDYSLELQSGKVVVTFLEGISITRDSVSETGDLKVEYPSKIYEQLLIATSILQQEIQFGDSDVTTIMQLYPEFLIEKLKRDEGTTLYVITDKDTKTKYQFASRSLAWPPGYGLT